MPVMDGIFSTIFSQNADVRKTVIEAVTSNPTLLSSTPVILVHKGSAEQIVYSAPPYKPWGVTLTCPHCSGVVMGRQDANQSRQNHERLKVTCTCKGCPWVKKIDRPEFLREVKGRPHYFYHHYPLSAAERAQMEGWEAENAADNMVVD
jgi:hypothetical protein